MERIDLHMHSIASLDGEFTYEEICCMAKKAGINTIAISDHNCVRTVKELLDSKTKYALNLIPAIEIDATCEGIDYHVLGYGIDVYDDQFERIEKAYLDQARSAGQQMMDKLIEYGFVFDKSEVEEMSESGIVTGEMVAEHLLNSDIDQKVELLNPYRNKGERSNRPYVNFYWDYCSSGKVAFVPISFPRVKEIVDLLHAQNAIAVLAHPGQNLHENIDHLQEVLQTGIDGVEVYSSYHNDEQIKFYHDWALKHDLLITCGSDFHGATKPDIKLGDHGMNIDQQQSTYDLLKQYALEV